MGGRISAGLPSIWSALHWFGRRGERGNRKNKKRENSQKKSEKVLTESVLYSIL